MRRLGRSAGHAEKQQVNAKFRESVWFDSFNRQDATTMDGSTADTQDGRLKEEPVQDILRDSLSDDDVASQSLAMSTVRINNQNNNNNNNNNGNGNGNLSILTDNLILTSATSVTLGVIDDLNVRCVISAAPELPDVPLSRSVVYRKIRVSDAPNSDLSSYFDQVADVISEVASAGGRTLIFCVAGVSRSASFSIAYLMKYHQLSLLDAYNYVKICRPRIKPNCGFFSQLIDYEKKLFGQNTVKMVYNEFVQMHIPDVYDHEYQIVRTMNRKFKDKCRR